MKLLVTGGTGFVGKRLVERFNEKFYLRMIARSKEKASFAQSLGVEILYGNILDSDFVHLACKGIDCVIHLAATYNLKNAVKNNVDSTKNIIYACQRNNVNKIVFMSSINSKFKKQGTYSLSKKLCEKEILNSHLDYTILRPTFIYDDNGGIFIKQLLKFIKKFRIAPIIGTGEYRIQPIHLDDVISIIEKILFNHKERIYDLVGPDILTYKTLTDMIYDSLGIKRKIKIHLPLIFLKYFGSFVGIGKDKVLEIDEDRTANPEIIKKELNMPLIEIATKLDLMIRNIH